MSEIFSSRRIAVRPLPCGYSLRVERAPLLIPGIAGHSDRAHMRRQADAFRSPGPLVVEPPVLVTDEWPDYAGEARASARHWTLATAGMLAVIVALAFLLSTLTHF